jgi:hypothetical protein
MGPETFFGVPGGVPPARSPTGTPDAGEQKPPAGAVVTFGHGHSYLRTWRRVEPSGPAQRNPNAFELTESNVERMRLRFRSLSPDHTERGALLRQLEIAAAVAGELESLLGLGGARSQQTDNR